MNRKHLAFALAALLPLTAQAQETPSGIRAEIRQEMADARKEVREELANAKRELDTENLDVGNGLHFGRHDAAHDPDVDLPTAEITPEGDFLLDGKAVAITASQRRQLLTYRGLVIDIAKSGIDAGERVAYAALEATDVSLFSLIFGGLTGSLERKIERTVKQEIEPMVRDICRQLPKVYDSQQRLSASLPQFEPYATLEPDDAVDCEKEVRDELALR
ncbi:hypothetical protein CSC70_07820 [Pseudoxanthomonas kalamensis DSM 18571]|uniref:hypothetical protein n=1 Tax=Pseudoxanthomonas kalamensis TaxID=289483 RepID=UPI0013909F5B|nr:hypothetical protein [Pseudoxanthomonas kalamensis]KAF1710558.1 hypothetical protein CSC70_07820 [Pseudoxanthomonas kalamensis DSM 18571]